MVLTKRIAVFIATTLLVLGVNSVQARVIKIATVSPDGSSWMKIMRAAGKDIEAQTEGRVKLKFYPGGVMGNDEAVMRKIRIGQLQGGAVTGGSLADIYSDVQVYSLPLKFRSFDEVDYVRERMDQRIVDGLEEKGFVSFGLGEGGFAYVLSQDAVTNSDELRSGKVWIPNNDDAALTAVTAFGVNPIPLNLSDVLAGLQTGLLDTVATSPIGAIALHWHTQVKYMNDLPVMYFFAMLAIDKKVFYRLSADDQAVFRDLMGKAFTEIDARNRKDNVAAYDALVKQGLQLSVMSDEEKAAWYATAAKAEKEIVDDGVISRTFSEELNGHLETFRSQQAAQ